MAPGPSQGREPLSNPSTAEGNSRTATKQSRGGAGNSGEGIPLQTRIGKLPRLSDPALHVLPNNERSSSLTREPMKIRARNDSLQVENGSAEGAQSGDNLDDISILDTLDGVEQADNTGRDDTHQVPHRDAHRLHDEEAQNNEYSGDVSPLPWRSIITLVVFIYTNVVVKVFVPLATGVCISNITAALGYVMLMNDPAPPKPSYIVGSLLTWFLTSGMMVCYGIYKTGMKDYARRLAILAMFTCFVVAVVFHFAGASNFASSFLVGITMAILLIQIW